MKTGNDFAMDSDAFKRTTSNRTAPDEASAVSGALRGLEAERLPPAVEETAVRHEADAADAAAVDDAVGDVVVDTVADPGADPGADDWGRS